MNDKIYPLTIISDRYCGTYSGGMFTAWNMDFYQIPKEVDGSDPDCRNFWHSFKQGELKGFMRESVFVGKGKTIEEAIKNLQKLIEASVS